MPVMPAHNLEVENQQSVDNTSGFKSALSSGYNFCKKALLSIALAAVVVAPYVGCVYLWKYGTNVADVTSEYIGANHNCHFTDHEVPDFCNDFVVRDEIKGHRSAANTIKGCAVVGGIAWTAAVGHFALKGEISTG